MNSSGEVGEHVRSIAVAVVLSIVTLGLFNLYWQYKQIQTVNDMMQETKYSFLPWLLLSLVTCGLYHIYHEYRMSDDLAKLCDREGTNDAIVTLALSIMGFSIVVDAIQQTHINKFYGDDRL